MLQIAVRCTHVFVWLGTWYPDYITSGCCKAEDQISALTKAWVTSLRHLPASPSLSTGHKQLPKAKPSLSFHWCHAYPPCIPAAHKSYSPQPHCAHQTVEACRLPPTTFLCIIWRVHGSSSVSVWYQGCASLRHDHSENRLWAPTQFCYFWEVLEPRPFPTFPRGCSHKLWWLLSFSATHPSVTIDPFSPPLSPLELSSSALRIPFLNWSAELLSASHLPQISTQTPMSLNSTKSSRAHV